jgi:hypothetical protein
VNNEELKPKILMPQIHAWSTRCQCVLRSSGGGCAAVVAAAQQLQPGESKTNHDA